MKEKQRRKLDKVCTCALVVDVPAMAPFPEVAGYGGSSEVRRTDALKPDFPWLDVRRLPQCSSPCYVTPKITAYN
jgi:hypothetical protein